MIDRFDVLLCVAGCPNREIFHALEFAVSSGQQEACLRSPGAQSGGWGGF